MEKEFLRHSLLFAMSLGSKELYHSNVWAWLIEEDGEFVKAFFDDFDESSFEVVKVDRECKHRDIIIWLVRRGGGNEKFYYVIENKIKSLISREQLEGYSENLWGNILLGGAFTGIKNTLGSDKLTLKNFEWRFVSYREIAARIRAIAARSASETIKASLDRIEEYCRIVEAIDSLLSSRLKLSDGELNYDCDLADLRLADVYKKLKGSDFFRYVMDRRAQLDALVPSGFETEFRHDFHNGKVTLDLRFVKREKDDHLTIGVQIEGDQYRLLVERGRNHTLNEIFDEFADKGWFDKNYDRSIGLLFGKPTSLKSRYAKYESEGYKFVYQYYNLDESNRGYETLFSSIKSDLTRVSKILQY